MLIGMALFKLEFLSTERSNSDYIKMMLIGFVFGFLLIIFGVSRNFNEGWIVDYSMFIGSQFNYWGVLASLLDIY